MRLGTSQQLLVVPGKPRRNFRSPPGSSRSDIPVAPGELALLDSRLADLETNPDDQSSWEEVRARLEKRRR